MHNDNAYIFTTHIQTTTLFTTYASYWDVQSQSAELTILFHANKDRDLILFIWLI